MLVFLVLITSGLQYLVQKMNYNRDLKRIETILEQARSAAWGSKLIPGEGQRKVSTCPSDDFTDSGSMRDMGTGLNEIGRSR